MNPKLVKLLYEGFSINTLEKLDDNQLTALYNKVVNEETSVTSTKYNLKDANDQKKFVEKVKASDPNKVKMNPTDDTATVGEGEVTEKSVSKKQHGLMGAAYSVEKGEKKLKDIPKSYREKVKNVVDSMSKKQVKDFAKTKTSKLPEKVDEVKKLEENILRILENHLPPHTTKGELVNLIKRRK